MDLVPKLRAASEHALQQAFFLQPAQIAVHPELRLIHKQPMPVMRVHHLPPAKFAALRREFRALLEKIAPSGAIQPAPVAERRLRGIFDQ